MKSLCYSIIAAGVVVIGSSTACAAVLDFEDLSSGPASYDIMPAPYSGFTFTGWYFGVDTFYTPASGVIDLFTDYADPNDPGAYVITNTNNQITSASTFVFDGASFSGYSGVTFELWLGGSMVHTSASIADSAGPDPYSPTFLASGYAGEIDKLVVSGVQGYYAMDDFTFHRTATAVSEPNSILLALMALGIMGVSYRRQY